MILLMRCHELTAHSPNHHTLTISTAPQCGRVCAVLDLHCADNLAHHRNTLTGSKKLMLLSMSGPPNARFFGLDMGDWTVLLGGFALAALVLFLN